jgi:small subunit ribosomal protein S6
MRDYETTFIVAPSLDSDGVIREVEAVKNFISSAGGEITAEKEWGRRRLMYPIRDCSEGVYHILRFRLASDSLGELERQFRLNENILRHLVIRDEGTPLEHIGQASESEERDRDSRDRRPGPPTRRFDGPKPAPSVVSKPAAVASTATAEVESPESPEPASEEGPDQPAGEEKSSE